MYQHILEVSDDGFYRCHVYHGQKESTMPQACNLTVLHVGIEPTLGKGCTAIVHHKFAGVLDNAPFFLANLGAKPYKLKRSLVAREDLKDKAWFPYDRPDRPSFANV